MRKHKNKTRRVRVNKGGRPKQVHGPLVPPEVEARRRSIAGDAWRSDAASRPLVALSTHARRNGRPELSAWERRAGEELAALHAAYRRAVGGPLGAGRPGEGSGSSDDDGAGAVRRMAAVRDALAQCPAPELTRAIVWSVCIDEDFPVDRSRWALVMPIAWRALHNGLAAVARALGLVMQDAA